MFSEIFYVSIEVLIALCAFFGNTFVIVLFCYDSRLKIKRNFHLVSLAFANILTSLLAIPLTILTFFKLPNNHDTLCYLELSIICFTRTLINFAIASIAFDRLKAVTNPYDYRSNNSKVSTFITIGLCWLISFVIGLLIMGWKREGEECNFRKIHPDCTLIFSIVGKILPYVIVIGCYGFICWSIFRARRRIETSTKSGLIKIAEKKEIRATIKITWIVGFLAICEMPLNFVNILASVEIYPSQMVIYSLLALAHVHAAINPFLYALNLNDFKRSLQKMLKKQETNSSADSRAGEKNSECRRSKFVPQNDADV